MTANIDNPEDMSSGLSMLPITMTGNFGNVVSNPACVQEWKKYFTFWDRQRAVKNFL
jgi:hypothetical protein